MKTLLIIDAQNDFCLSEGALAVPGAEADCARLADWMATQAGGIDRVLLTLDQHDRRHIAHPLSWHDQSGHHPQPFTVIDAAAVAAGDWQPSNPELREWAQDYVQALAGRNGPLLLIWPEHCLTGTPGAQLHPAVADGVAAWAEKRQSAPYYFFKGHNPRTEHYSAYRAEVPDPKDPTTEENALLRNLCAGSREVYIAGQALSHCVALTVKDLMDAVAKTGARPQFKLLRDTTSPVAGFEATAEEFLAWFRQNGGTILHTHEAQR